MATTDPVTVQTHATPPVVAVPIAANPSAVVVATNATPPVVTVPIAGNPDPVVVTTHPDGYVVYTDIEGPAPSKPNVVLVIMENVGLSLLGAYDDLNRWPAGYFYAPTPWLDAKIADGIRYTNCRANMDATASRASILTGRSPHTTPAHTGTGLGVYSSSDQAGITASMWPLPKTVRAANDSFTAQLFGQWDMGDIVSGSFDYQHAVDVAGFAKSTIHDHEKGIIGDSDAPYHGYSPYTEAIYEEGGSLAEVTPSLPILPGKTCDRLIDFFQGLASTNSFFATCDFSYVRGAEPATYQNGPSWDIDGAERTVHTQFTQSQLYPAATGANGFGDPRYSGGGDPEDGPAHIRWRRATAMVETIDSLLALAEAQLPAAVAAKTVWIITSASGSSSGVIRSFADNWQNTTHGAYGWTVEPPTISGTASTDVADHYHSYKRAAGSAYDDGTRVPLVVCGAIPAASKGQDCTALVESSDIYATALELMSENAWKTYVDTAQIDGESFHDTILDPTASGRTHAFSEFYTPQGVDVGSESSSYRAVTNADFWRFVEIYVAGVATYRLHDLTADPNELTNLYPPTTGEEITQHADLLAAFNARLA